MSPKNVGWVSETFSLPLKAKLYVIAVQHRSGKMELLQLTLCNVTLVVLHYSRESELMLQNLSKTDMLQDFVMAIGQRMQPEREVDIKQVKRQSRPDKSASDVQQYQ